MTSISKNIRTAKAKAKKVHRSLGLHHYSESDNRIKFQSAVRNNGVACWPVENKVGVGMSDTYVDGGNWVEFKHTVMPKRRTKRLLSVPEAKQREFCGRHVLNPMTWDRTFLAFLIQPHDYSEAWLVAARFDAFCHPFGLDWEMKKVREHGVEFYDTEALEAYVGQIFGRAYDRNSNFDGDATCLGLDLTELVVPST